ncbi:hypothetical protein SDC9_180151 [bioreactor metagenome]|uniref:Uncharacterized protein n=1 Tax=bioreactor metagenome TaxID=1076179 RepID=A0A645H0U0_9ZZZZ
MLGGDALVKGVVIEKFYGGTTGLKVFLYRWDLYMVV